jgi:hypothetical protein
MTSDVCGREAMRAIAWVASHVAALVGIQLLAAVAGAAWQGSLLYGLPLAIGAVQWAFLARDLRWWGVLWLPACQLGLFLSFFGAWWFLPMIATGMGLAQTPILAMAGFRRWWLWAPASGLGWFVGMVLGSGVQDLLGASLGSDVAGMSGLYAVTTLAYGALTAAALHLMPQLSAGVRIAEDESQLREHADKAAGAAGL